MPAVGFAAGVERLVIALTKLRETQAQLKVDAYLVGLNAEARPVLFELANRLRQAGIATVFDVQERSMKAQMREANRLGTRRVMILGESELAAQSIVVKNMEDGSQETIPLSEVLGYFTSAENASRANAASAA